jgi:hypothetical protein
MKMPSWLENSLRTGYEMKDKAIIIECHKMWNEILISKQRKEDKALGLR